MQEERRDEAVSDSSRDEDGLVESPQVVDLSDTGDRVEDSGVGSASERTPWSEERDIPRLSVLERAKRLQGEINAREQEEKRRNSWMRGGSVDSLLDWESDSTRPPSLPPKSSLPPSLPPRGQEDSTDPSPPPLPPKSNLVHQKRASLSEEADLGRDSLESLYSMDKFSYTMEDGYMEDGYILDHSGDQYTPGYVEYSMQRTTGYSGESDSSQGIQHVSI